MKEVVVASVVREAVARSAGRFWHPDDFDGPPQAVAKALSRLVSSGELRRIRRGVYWRGESTRLGMAPPSPQRVVQELVEPLGVGPARWSAGLALGLSTQVPREEIVAVPGRAPQGSGSVRFVSRAACTARRDEQLRPIEVALLEVLRDWDVVVDVAPDFAVECVSGFVRSELINIERVVAASRTEPPRVRERLRWLLGSIGRPELVGRVRPPRGQLAAGIHPVAS